MQAQNLVMTHLLLLQKEGGEGAGGGAAVRLTAAICGRACGTQVIVGVAVGPPGGD